MFIGPNYAMMNELEFIKHYVANASQLMWFLGAGTSRSAGMPTATDIIWDLKLKYYCLKQNQDIKNHDISNDVIKQRTQTYMDSLNYPALWSSEEYSFYFELTFGNDYDAQRKYLVEKLNSKNISLNIGHRVLGALIELQKAKVIFSTNFDEVIETAYSKISGKNLSTYHLEGSYAALEALNAENFPIYAKVHGDFKYRSVKNLSSDLLNNDQKIQDCFLAACVRYGMVVTGYSGRDANVMTMFKKAIESHNAFPSGLFWTVPNNSNVLPIVTDTIEFAKSKGIKAAIIEAGTFDIMMSKIWKQTPNATVLNTQVYSAASQKVAIPLEAPGSAFPVIRTNALPIVQFPKSFAVIETPNPISNDEFKTLMKGAKVNAILSKPEMIAGWGDEELLLKPFESLAGCKAKEHTLVDPIQTLSESTLYQSFFENGLVRCLVEGKPLFRHFDHGHYITVDHSKSSDVLFDSLKLAVGYHGQKGNIHGRVPDKENVFWSEAVKLRTEVKCGIYWLFLTPTIWINPSSERQNLQDFLRKKKLKRWNATANNLLDAWIKLLLGDGKSEIVETSCFAVAKYPIKFGINTRTAYSRT